MTPILQKPKLFINTNINTINNKFDVFYEYNYDDNGIWGQYTDIENQVVPIKNEYPIKNANTIYNFDTSYKPDTNIKPDIKPDTNIKPDIILDINSNSRSNHNPKIDTDIYYDLDEDNNKTLVNYIIGQIHIVGIICVLTIGNILLP